MGPRKTIAPEHDIGETDSPFGDAVVVPIDDSIDLHPFHPNDIPSLLGEYLEQCLEAGIYEVHLIHGRGTGVQRKIVRSILGKHPAVYSFHDAPPQAGGWGATVVTLKKDD